MSKVSATEIFNMNLDRAYQFSLFFFTAQNPNPKSLGKGSLSEREVLEHFQRPHLHVLTAWEYPRRFVLDQKDGPVISRIEMGFHPASSGVEVTWAFSLNPTSLVGRILTAIHRRQMKHTKGRGSEIHKNLIRLKTEAEQTNSGLEEAFLQFQEVLKKGRPSAADTEKTLSRHVRGLLRCAAFFTVLAGNRPEPTEIDKEALEFRDSFAWPISLHLEAIRGRRNVTEREINEGIEGALEELKQINESGEALCVNITETPTLC